MKKNGFINGLIKASILAATLGGTIYLLKDKIEECPKCRESLDKAKSALNRFHSGKSDDLDYTEDFEDDFDDVEELDEILETPADREYVSIKLSEEMNHEADEDGVSGTEDDNSEDAFYEEEVEDETGFSAPSEEEIPASDVTENEITTEEI